MAKQKRKSVSPTHGLVVLLDKLCDASLRQSKNGGRVARRHGLEKLARYLTLQFMCALQLLVGSPPLLLKTAH